MIDKLTLPFGEIIRFFYNLTGGNYFLSLFIFLFIVSLVTFPLSLKQKKDAIKKQRLNPYIQAIINKYPDTKSHEEIDKRNKELTEFYKKNKVHVFGGVPAMLIRLPIVFAVYRVVTHPLRFIIRMPDDMIALVAKKATDISKVAVSELQSVGTMNGHFSEFSGISGLSKYVPSAESLPKLLLFGGRIDLSQIPSFKNFNLLLLVPVIVYICLITCAFLSAKINKAKGVPGKKKEKGINVGKLIGILLSPAVTVYFAFKVPVAVSIYFVFQSIFGVLTELLLRWILSFRYSPPEKLTDTTKEGKVQGAETSAPCDTQSEDNEENCVEECGVVG